MTDLDRDIFILAVTADCEASNQGDEGITAVLWSIVNRSRVGKWYSGKTIAATCLKPYAYSSWNTEDPNRVRVLSSPITDPSFARCVAIATDVLFSKIPDPTDGATHYHSTKIAEPTWVYGINEHGERVAPPAVFTKQIGDHRFYKGVQ